MKITLFHADDATALNSMFFREESRIFGPGEAIAAFNNHGYNAVMFGEYIGYSSVYAALEQVWEATQNVDEPWDIEAPKRSSMVGDIAVVDEKDFYIVASIGWVKLDIEG